jgi:hypothetical protein
MAIKRFLPSLAVSNDAAPLGWSQNWSHLLATAANHSRIATSNALRGLPLAQEVLPSKQLGLAGSTHAGWPRGGDRHSIGRSPRANLGVVDEAITARLKEHAWKTKRVSDIKPLRGASTHTRSAT